MRYDPFEEMLLKKERERVSEMEREKKKRIGRGKES